MSQQKPYNDNYLPQINGISSDLTTRRLFLKKASTFVEVANSRGIELEKDEQGNWVETENIIGRVVKEYGPPSPSVQVAELKIPNGPSIFHTNGKSFYNISLSILFRNKVEFTDFIFYCNNHMRYLDERGGIYDCVIDNKTEIKRHESGNVYMIKLSLKGIKKETIDYEFEFPFTDLSTDAKKYTLELSGLVGEFDAFYFEYEGDTFEVFPLGDTDITITENLYNEIIAFSSISTYFTVVRATDTSITFTAIENNYSMTVDLYDYSEDNFDLSDTTWEEAAGSIPDAGAVRSLAVFNDKLYGGTNAVGKLFEWNDVDTWVEVAPSFGGLFGEDIIYDLLVYNNELYGATGNHGKLLRWNGVDAWVEASAQYGSETDIFQIVEYNNEIYGTSYPNGKLLKWDGVSAWVEMADTLGTEVRLRGMLVFNNKIYAGTEPGGKLLEWNGLDAWVEVAPQLNSEGYIVCLEEFNGKLYAGTGTFGRLYEWNGVDAWVEVASQFGTQEFIASLLAFNNTIYAGTQPNGKLLEWNGTNSWSEVAGQFLTEQRAYDLTEYNNKIYAGTYPDARLFEWGEYTGNKTIDEGDYQRLTTPDFIEEEVGRHWSYDNVKSFTELGLVTTLDANANTVYTFRPDANASRAEVATFINKLRKYLERMIRG